MPLLSIRDVSIRFGGIEALRDLSLDVEEGEICGLIGPNGAGKTTLFNCISRIYTPDRGSISFRGKQLLKVPPHRPASLGIGRTFQNVAIFNSMTVLENVLVGAYSWMRGNPLTSMVRWPAVVRDERNARERAFSLMDYLDLSSVAQRTSGDLPFPTRKRLELARALMSSPKLLLLDEPAGGLNHEELADLRRVIERLTQDFSLTLLLVEHHMEFVMGMSHKICVLDFGQKIAEGPPAVVQRDPNVIRAYLGETGHDARIEEDDVQ